MSPERTPGRGRQISSAMVNMMSNMMKPFRSGLVRMTGRMTGTKTGTAVLGPLLAALLLSGFAGQAAAQSNSISPTEIYEGETVTFTASRSTDFSTYGRKFLKYVDSDGSTISLADLRANYTFASADTGSSVESGGNDLLSFDPDQANDFSFTITAAADAVDQDETLILSIGDYYDISVFAAITLKDGARPVSATDGVTVSESSLALTEGHASDGEGSYTVVLDTDPGATVSIAVSSDDTSAATVSPSTLTFTGGASGTWGTAQKVTVTAQEDGDAAGETVTVSHAATVSSDSSNAYHQIAIADVSVALTDAGHGVLVSESSLAVNAGASATYKLRLKSQPGGSVTITPTSSATARATVSPATLTFGNADWDDEQTVTVTGAAAATTGTATVSHAITTATTTYPTTQSIASVAVAVTAAANTAPVFGSATLARSVAENSASGTNVGAAIPAATDADNDSLTYTLEGTDAASFAFDASTRQISTTSGVNYDHEATSSYSVTVKADDGKGGTDTVVVTITVTDVNEPPAAPGAPTVSATAGSTTGLDVSWTAPANTGKPAISSYDLRHRAGSSGAWTNGPQNVATTSSALTGLTAGTSYEVQVRATNAEGDSNWSASGSGATSTPANTAPTSADHTVTVNEDTAYTFTAADFVFADADPGDTLSSVKITTLETAGDLELDSAAVTANQVITQGDIDDGDLTFTPAAHGNGSGYATFGFKVNDGTADSTAAYTMTINVTAVNDVPAGVPTITGKATQGETLTAVTSAIADADGLGTFNYQWKRGGTPITSATSSTYTLVQVDVGSTITVTVSWTDGGGTVESLTSAATGPVTSTDTTAPTVTSITRQSTNSGGATNANSLVWRVTFSEAVQNVDATDFDVTGTGIGSPTVAVAAVTNTGGASYDVTASGGNLAELNATVTLGFDSAQNIQDTSSNALTTTLPDGVANTYKVDNTAPTISTSSFPSNWGDGARTVTITFSEVVTGFASADVTVTGATTSVFASAQAGRSWLIGISPATTNGTPVTLAIAANAASDAAGNSNAAFSISADYTRTLEAPATFTATAGDTQVTLNWGAPSDSAGTAALTKYQYRYKVSSASNWGSWTDVGDSGDDGSDATDETSVVVTGLTNGTAYSFELRAVNAAGDGAAASATATPTVTTLPVVSIGLMTQDGQEKDDEQRLIHPEDGTLASFNVNMTPTPTSAFDVCIRVTEAGGERVASSAEGVKTVSIPVAGTVSHEVMWTDTAADDRDSLVTVEGVAPGTAGCTATGYTVSDTDDSRTVRVQDSEATPVSLTSSDTAMTEGKAAETATLTVSLGRRLYAGEVIVAPFTLATTTGARLPGSMDSDNNANHDFTVSASGNGVTVIDAGTTSPDIKFTGHDTNTVQTATVTLTPVANRDDGDTEDESLTARLGSNSALGSSRFDDEDSTNVGGGAIRATNYEVDLTLNEPPALPVFSVGFVSSVLESDSSVLCTVVRTSPASTLTSSLTVHYRVSQTGDFLAAGETGDKSFTRDLGTSGYSTIRLVNDAVDEPDGAVTCTLRDDTSYTVGTPSSATVVIKDDDPTVVSLNRVGTTGAVTEGGTVEFTVTLGRALVAGEIIDVPLSISGTNVTTADWSLALKTGTSLNTGVTLSGETTATPKVQFSGASAQTATLVLTATADTTAETGGETVTVELGPDGSTDANGFDHTTLATNVGGGADPHNTANSFDVVVNDPVLPEISIAPKTANTPVTEGTAAVFTVTANTAPTADLTVNLTVADAPNNADFVSLTNEGSGKSVTITGGETTADYSVLTVGGNSETDDEPSGNVTVTVNGGTNYTVSGSSSSAMVKVNDNDPTVVSLNRVGTTGAVTEGGTVEFTVTLGRALVAGEIIDVPLSISGTNVTTADWSLALKTGTSLNTGVTLSGETTATPKVQFSGASAQTATLVLTATADTTAETGGETVTVELGPDGSTDANGFDHTTLATNVGGGADPHNTANSFDVVVNDPVLPEISIAPKTANTPVTEGTAAVFTVTANTAPTADLTVNLTVADAPNNADFVSLTNEGSGKSVTITGGETTADYSVLTVGGNSETDDEPSGNVTVTVNGGTNYTVSGSSSSAMVKVNDNDATTVALAAGAAGNIAEGADKTFSVTLSRGLYNGEILPVPLTFGGTATRGTDYTTVCPSTLPTGVTCASLDSGNAMVTFTGPNTGQSATSVTLTLSAATDSTDTEGNETVTIDLGALTSSTGTNLGGGASGSGSVSFSIIDVDTTAPRVTSINRQTPTTSPTNANSLTWRVVFNEAVQNVDGTDFTITGVGLGSPTLTVAAVSNSTTTYDVSASGGNLATLDATVTLGFDSSQNIQDTTGNALTNTTPTGDDHNTWTVDNTGPTVSITGVSGTITGAVTATVEFSEEVQNFVAGDIAVTGAATSNFTATTARRIWTVELTPSINGTAVTVNIAANVASDAAGNGNEAATEARAAYTVRLGAPATFNANPMDGAVTLTWSAPADSAGSAALTRYEYRYQEGSTVTTATWTPVPDGDDDGTDVTDETSFTVTGLSNGAEYAFQLRAVNSAGDGRAASATATPVSSDTTPPTVTAVTRQSQHSGGVTNADDLLWRVTFSEAVENVDDTDFTITGAGLGSPSLTVTGAGTTYNVTASGGNLATLDATVTLGFANNQDIEDSAGNALNTTATGTYTVDNTAPTVEITGVGGTITGAVTATVTFSEEVENFVVGDIAVTGAATSNFTATTARRIWTVDLTPSANGTPVTVNIAANVASDDAGHGNAAATGVRADYTVPLGVPATFIATPRDTAVILNWSAPADSAGTAALTRYQYRYQEGGTVTTAPWTNVDDGDDAGTAVTDETSLTIPGLSNGTEYAFQLRAVNRAGDGAAASTTAVPASSDTTFPTVTAITRRSPHSRGVTNADSLVWRVTFSEAVQNVDGAAFTVTGVGLVTPDLTVTGAGATYDVTASGGNLADLDATVRLDFANNQDIQDTAGNPLASPTPTGANEDTYTVDNTAPTVEITGVGGTITGAVTATVRFSEEVENFLVGDIAVTGATISEFAEITAGTVWTVVLTPSDNSTVVTVNIAANVASDAAGNGNEAATGVRADYTVTPDPPAPGPPAPDPPAPLPPAPLPPAPLPPAPLPTVSISREQAVITEGGGRCRLHPEGHPSADGGRHGDREHGGA